MKKKCHHIITTVCVLLTLTGCASIFAPPPKPPEPIWDVVRCQHTDWYLAGLAQDPTGQVNTDIQKIAAECAEQGVQIDTSAYFLGMTRAAQQYCIPSQARLLGQQGKAYPKLCQPQIYTQFHYEWYRYLRDYCHMQSLEQKSPKICKKILVDTETAQKL